VFKEFVYNAASMIKMIKWPL